MLWYDTSMKKIILAVVIVALAAAGALFFNVRPAGTEDPAAVVMAYARHTLRTLPDSDYDLEKAKAFFPPDSRAMFNDPSFIPRSYGIQDGPQQASARVMNMMNGQATVELTGVFGNSAVRWRFMLVSMDGSWKIVSYKRAA